MKFHCLVRAIDFYNGSYIAGFRDGSIRTWTNDPSKAEVAMNGHCDGEVWGLAQSGTMVITSGDDNQVIAWDPNTRRQVVSMEVSNEKKKARKNKASVHSDDYADSQCSRAVASFGDFKVYGANDGRVHVTDG